MQIVRANYFQHIFMKIFMYTKKKIFIIFIYFVLIAFVLIGVMSSPNKSDTELRVLFSRLYRLGKDTPIIDPFNTETVDEYYLLENLTVGLVRDSSDDLRGYEPGLAEKWWQVNPTAWSFKIQNLKWSDGQPITLNQIKENLLRLKTSNGRHILYMRALKDIYINYELNEILLQFSEPVNSGLIHELSLADSGLLHTNNLKSDWNITSGPYAVSNIDLVSGQIMLKLNEHCPLTRKASYKKIKLFFPQDASEILRSFSEFPFDIHALPPYKFREKPQILIKNAPRSKLSTANLIYFFAFNPDNIQKNSISTRIRFASAFREFPIILPEGIKSNNQMLPFGYAGHLSDFTIKIKRLVSYPEINIKILLPAALKETTLLLDSIRSSLKMVGFATEITFNDSQKFDSTVFAQLYNFKGNQRESLGSWAFLFSEGNGPLSFFRPQVELLFKQVTAVQDENARKNTLLELHIKVLEEVFAVPIAVEPSIVLHSERIKLNRWNLFDLRTRYYEVE
ncbi:MAG: hypothetical protein A2Z20_01510 [Bdellovibrionales bacterium RBG_16_40_8]|nr:MAG: hypothetical protein A2Z20_01510 [Bdellovibrionales bacterium RBG_16_40_8]